RVLYTSVTDEINGKKVDYTPRIDIKSLFFFFLLLFILPPRSPRMRPPLHMVSSAVPKICNSRRSTSISRPVSERLAARIVGNPLMTVVRIAGNRHFLFTRTIYADAVTMGLFWNDVDYAELIE